VLGEAVFAAVRPEAPPAHQLRAALLVRAEEARDRFPDRLGAVHAALVPPWVERPELLGREFDDGPQRVGGMNGHPSG
jgi:hypothetical protein